MYRLGCALVLLAVAGQAAGVGATDIPDATGDVSFSSYYSVLGLRARNACWALELECSEVEEASQEDLECDAPPLDITHVSVAVTPDGLLRGSMTLADLDGDISCAIRGEPTGIRELHRADHRQGYAGITVTDEAGLSIRLSHDSVRSDRLGSDEDLHLGMFVPQVGSFCFDLSGWREGDTIGFEVPVTGIVRNCVRDETIEYALTGTLVGRGAVFGLGGKSYVGNELKWSYLASDDASDASQRITVP